MRAAAIAFALALGAASPAIGATSPTTWSEERFVTTLMELSVSYTGCKAIQTSSLKMNRLMELADERFGEVDLNADRHRGIMEVVMKAAEKPATFCWTMLAKYGPEGTALPGMVTPS